MMTLLHYFRLILVILSIMLIVMACQPEQAAVIVEITQAPSQPRVIYVTPTQEPTGIPTVSIISPTPSPTPSLTPSPTPDIAAREAQCSAVLTTLYTQASELCLGEASGAFCNGGIAPYAEPQGRISASLAQSGALVEAGVLDLVQTSPLLTDNSGGVVWMRLQEATTLNALLVGDVTVRDTTPPDGGFDPWLSFVVETGGEVDCNTAPRSAFIAQGPYGATASFVVNGVSLDLNGTVVIQTIGEETHFTALEGRSRLTVFGTSRDFYAGEQVNIPYADGTFARPSGNPPPPIPLTFSEIRNLPIVLLDRPVLLPQPGLVRTINRTNMRSEPDEEAQLLFQVPSDEPLSILGQNPEESWYHVRLGNGETGWMRSDLVDGTVGEVNSNYAATPVPPQRLGAGANRAIVVAAQGGNLREAPDVSFRVLATLPENTEVELIARSPYSSWVKVDTGTQLGWMALITLETKSVIQFLPIDYSVPLPLGPTATPAFSFGGGHAYPDPRGGS